MLMEGWVKIFSPQNAAGVSQKKGIAVISQTIVVNGVKTPLPFHQHEGEQ